MRLEYMRHDSVPAFFREARRQLEETGQAHMLLQPGDGTRYPVLVQRTCDGYVFAESLHGSSWWHQVPDAPCPMYLAEKMPSVKPWAAALYADVLRMLRSDMASPRWYDWEHSRPVETGKENA